MPPKGGNIFICMIEVVKVIGSPNTDRPSKIYSSIFGRAAKYYPKEERLKKIKAVFIEKRIDFDSDWCNERVD
jgi:hypothetical protein